MPARDRQADTRAWQRAAAGQGGGSAAGVAAAATVQLSDSWVGLGRARHAARTAHTDTTAAPR
jgi:hypothetical protein